MELEKFIVKGEVLAYPALVPQVYPYTNQTNISLHMAFVKFFITIFTNHVSEEDVNEKDCNSVVTSLLTDTLIPPFSVVV